MTVQKYFYLFIITIFSTSIYAQGDSIIFEPSWNKGETLVYAMTYSDNHQNKNGFVLGSVKDTNFIFMQPLKIKDGETILSIRYSKTENIEQDTHVYLNAGLNHEIFVTLNKNGGIIDLYNWVFLSNKYKEQNKKNLEDDIIDSGMYYFYDQFYSEKLNVRSTALEDILKLFRQYGQNNIEGNKYLITKKIPNPFMGPILVAKGTSLLEKPEGSKFVYKLEVKCGTDSTYYIQLANDFVKYKKSKEDFSPPPSAPQFYIGNEEMTLYNTAQKRIIFCYVEDKIISETESRYVGVKYVLIDVKVEKEKK